MTTDLKRLTDAEYLALPEMRARYSIVDGELVMAAAPTPDHQRVVQRTFVKLDAFVQAHQIGTVFLAPLDVVIRRDPLLTRPSNLDLEACRTLKMTSTTTGRLISSEIDNGYNQRLLVVGQAPPRKVATPGL